MSWIVGWDGEGDGCLCSCAVVQLCGCARWMEMRGRTAVGVYDTDGERGGQAIERWFRPVGRGVLLLEQITGSNPAEVRRRLHYVSFCHQRSGFPLLFLKQNRITSSSFKGFQLLLLIDWLVQF